MAQMVLGSLDSGMGKMLLDKLIGAGAANLAGLKYIPSPAGKQRGFTMFANVSDVPDNILDQVDQNFQQWSARYGGEKNQLIVIVGPDGLHVRVRTAISNIEQLEAFFDQAQEIAILLKGPSP